MLNFDISFLFVYMYFFVAGSSLTMQTPGDNPKVVLVFFIGGCTFAEISALRFLSQQEDSDGEWVLFWLRTL